MKNIAIIQMISTDQVAENLHTCKKLLKKCAKEKAELVLLPENFACMVNQDQDRLTIAEQHGDGPIQDFLQQQAKELGLWIIAGTIPLKTTHQNKVTATSLVFDAAGNEKARYDKLHLFDVTVNEGESYQESAFITPGNHYQVVDTPVGKVGLSVCYDLRFPEQYRQLMHLGAEILVVPSAFTDTTGKAHWHTLLKARAIENLAFVAAANQGGLHRNGRKTYGHSCFIAPWGNIVSELEYGEGVIITQVNLEQLNSLRLQFPCLDQFDANSGKMA